MSLLTRDAFTTHKVRTETIEVPELGGSLKIRNLSGEEVEKFYQSLTIHKGRGQKQRTTVKQVGFRSKIIILGAINDDGSQMFTGADEALLNKLDAAVSTRLCVAIQRLSGMLDDDEDTEKNFEETDGDSSPSVSPSR